jgi:hypothetical protein
MGNPKRHHYVPESYLLGFTKERTEKGVLFVYDIEKQEIRPQLPKDTCVQGYYNAVELADGSRSFELESALATIEGRAVPVIQKIDTGEALSPQERDTLSIYIALQKRRVPDFESDVGQMTEKTMKAMLGIAFESEERAKQMLEEYEKDTGAPLGLSAKEMMEFIAKDKYRIETGRNESLRVMMNLAEGVAKRFMGMDWMFLHSPPGSAFVTSDNPFHIIPPSNLEEMPIWMSYGYATLGAKKLIPLSMSVGLVMGDPGDRIQHAAATKEIVRTFNLGIASDAYRFLIGHEENLVLSLAKNMEKAVKRRGFSWGGPKIGRRKEKGSGCGC